MRQLNLNFTGIPITQTRLWEQFGDEQKRTVIENPGAPDDPSRPTRPTPGGSQ